MSYKLIFFHSTLCSSVGRIRTRIVIQTNGTTYIYVESKESNVKSSVVKYDFSGFNRFSISNIVLRQIQGGTKQFKFLVFLKC